MNLFSNQLGFITPARIFVFIASAHPLSPYSFNCLMTLYQFYSLCLKITTTIESAMKMGTGRTTGDIFLSRCEVPEHAWCSLIVL